VTNMYAMFWKAESFNQPLNSWDTSSVTDMQSMFSGATAFNQDLNSWDVNKVTGQNTCSYFCYKADFNPTSRIPSFPGNCGNPKC
jgi:surface protein